MMLKRFVLKWAVRKDADFWKTLVHCNGTLFQDTERFPFDLSHRLGMGNSAKCARGTWCEQRGRLRRGPAPAMCVQIAYTQWFPCSHLSIEWFSSCNVLVAVWSV